MLSWIGAARMLPHASSRLARSSRARRCARRSSRLSTPATWPFSAGMSSSQGTLTRCSRPQTRTGGPWCTSRSRSTTRTRATFSSSSCSSAAARTKSTSSVTILCTRPSGPVASSRSPARHPPRNFRRATRSHPAGAASKATHTTTFRRSSRSRRTQTPRCARPLRGAHRGGRRLRRNRARRQLARRGAEAGQRRAQTHLRSPQAPL
mmetsp:Transcript_55552/g.131910  ORF Transcript_55552/g.131910 Transcript_55552/m.131910 type:complete len:207 (+) Transcript_55552:1152-1772(+)